IIIPTYNRAHLISETLDSVLAQTYTNWECLVVDDGSTDATEALLYSYIEKDSRFHYHKRPDRHLPGGNGARNYGFEVSKGEFIQWFDSDDFMMPEKLELKVAAILKHDVDFVVCEHAEIYGLRPYKIRKKWPIRTDGDELLNHLNGSIAFTTAGPLFRKSFLDKKRLFDESILIGQEWEFFTRLLITKPKIYYLHEVVYHFQNISNGIRGNLTDEKIKNRIQTEINLFKKINSSSYYMDSKYKEIYNRYKSYRVLNRSKYIYKNYSFTESLLYFMNGIKTISISYYIIIFFRFILEPKTIRVLFTGWHKN
ncbi:MAG TPA: hypothetical protein DHV22_15925, partial [Xanthomarina gelatinilytica]|nr:hypothetical protein [Xanthomarina gelatinilytica]